MVYGQPNTAKSTAMQCALSVIKSSDLPMGGKQTNSFTTKVWNTCIMNVMQMLFVARRNKQRWLNPNEQKQINYEVL